MDALSDRIGYYYCWVFRHCDCLLLLSIAIAQGEHQLIRVRGFYECCLGIAIAY
jgi:hypothetical protein